MVVDEEAGLESEVATFVDEEPSVGNAVVIAALSTELVWGGEGEDVDDEGVAEGGWAA